MGGHRAPSAPRRALGPGAPWAALLFAVTGCTMQSPPVGGGVEASAAVTASGKAHEPIEDSRCSDFQLDVEKVWSHRVESSVSAGLVTASGGFGEKVAVQVKTKLDGFARNWVLLKESACRDCLLRETLSQAAYNRISGCLDAVLVRQSTLLELAKSPSRDQVVLLGQALESIGDELKRCRSDAPDGEPAFAGRAAKLAAPNAGPEEPAGPRLRQLLAEAETLEQLASFAAAEAKTGEALTLAHQSGHLEREVDALVREASIKSARGESTRAVESAVDAEAKASRASYRPGRLSALIELSRAELALGRFEESNAHLDAARALAQPGSPEELAILVSSGENAFAQGKYGDARGAFQKALPVSKSAFGEAHVRTAEVMNNLAATDFAMGADEQALKLFERVLIIHQSELGAEHPATATTLNNIGAVLARHGNFDRAREAYEKALTIRQNALGPSHPDVANSYTNLGSVYQAEKDYAKANESYQSALGIYRQLGDDHSPELASTLNNLGTTQMAMGELDLAKVSYEKALGLRERDLGPQHPDTAASLGRMAELAVATKELDAAQKLAERALAIRLGSYGPSHPETRLSYQQLAAILEQRGKFTQAVGYLQKNLAAVSSGSGARITALEALSHMEDKAGQHEPAILHQSEALELRRHGGPPDRTSTLAAEARLAALCKGRKTSRCSAAPVPASTAALPAAP